MAGTPVRSITNWAQWGVPRRCHPSAPGWWRCSWGWAHSMVKGTTAAAPGGMPRARRPSTPGMDWSPARLPPQAPPQWAERPLPVHPHEVLRRSRHPRWPRGCWGYRLSKRWGTPPSCSLLRHQGRSSPPPLPGIISSSSEPAAQKARSRWSATSCVLNTHRRRTPKRLHIPGRCAAPWAPVHHEEGAAGSPAGDLLDGVQGSPGRVEMWFSATTRVRLRQQLQEEVQAELPWSSSSR